MSDCLNGSLKWKQMPLINSPVHFQSSSKRPAFVKQHIKWLASPRNDRSGIRTRARVWFSSWLAADAPLPPPFFNSIRTSRVMMIMMMVTMIITVTIFTPIFAGSESVSRVKCQVQSRALAADPCRFVFPPRHLGEAASIRPSDRSQGTAAISGSQYNASPVPSEPTMQNANRKPEHLPPRMAPREERRGGEGGETEKQTIITSRIACLSSLRAAWEDFSFQIVKWGRINERIYKERSGILPLSSTSKRTFLSRSGGGRGGGGRKSRGKLGSLFPLSPLTLQI